MAQSRWSPESWRGKPIEQAPVYADPAALAEVERQLAGYPPLVFAGEARKLKSAFGKAVAGEAFLLQGGDCAESFARAFGRQHPRFLPRLPADGGRDDLRGGLADRQGRPRRRAVRQAALVRHRDDRRRVAAGLSRRHRQRHRIHRGGARTPDPRRQLEAYRQSAATLNLLRAFATGGYANLENAHRWMLGFVKDSPQSERYQELADRITETLGFMRAIGLDAEAHPELRATDFYTSHEALLLGYEQAMTRLDSTSGEYYATSGHMLWIGDRTRQLGGAHVEYARGIRNPIGLKCGPSIAARRPHPPDRRARSRARSRAG